MCATTELQVSLSICFSCLWIRYHEEGARHGGPTGEKKSGGGWEFVEIITGMILRANVKWGIFVLLGSKFVCVDVSCLSVFPWRGRDSNIKYVLTL